jgi:SAM-dependent methyltransferase
MPRMNRAVSKLKQGFRRVPLLVAAVHALRRRRQIRIRDRAAAAYLAKPGLRKLQIGSSIHVLDGWFNVDIFPVYAGQYYMDATERFPFPDASFELIFTEHMIEHVEYLQAFDMLKECWRVMRPGGTIRIGTPDLEFIAGLYSPDGSARQEQYKAAVIQRWRLDSGSREIGIVVNNIYNFDHRFIYDRRTLSELLYRAGFTKAQVREVGKSPIPEFNGIEVHCLDTSPDDYVALETLVVEATKPLSLG